MTISELITKLQLIEDQEKYVSIVVGNEDENIIDTYDFELHHTDDIEHPLEIFILLQNNGCTL